MSWVSFWKFLHITCVFAGITLVVGGGVINGIVQKGKDVRAILGVMAAEAKVHPVGGVLMVAGLIFGFATAIAGGFSLTAPWLLISYGLFIGIILMGVLYHGPQGRRLEEAVNASPEDEPSSELLAVIAANSGNRAVNFVDTVLWVGLVFTMVFKPFGV